MTNKTIREKLLRLIENAPDPCGFEKVLPGYQAAWDAARAELKATCPDHKDNGAGTCEQCHGDMGIDGEAP